MSDGFHIPNYKEIPSLLLSAFVAISLQATSKRPKHSNDDDDDGKCELIGTFSLITQAFLGILCLSSLIVKRFYEYPLRRTWPVWFFDVMKQLVGALGVHVFNVFMSILKTQKDPSILFGAADDEYDNNNDPCDWYFLNIVFDCTIGVLVLYFVFGAVNNFCRNWLKLTQIESGSYGPNPDSPSLRAFLKQLAVYFGSLMITKIILYGIVVCFETQLLWITSHILLVWLDEYPDEFEIFVVMFVVPVVMNCLQLILVDNIIQNQIIGKVNERVHHEHEEGMDVDEDTIQNDINEFSGHTVHGHKRCKRHHTKDNGGIKNYGTFDDV